LVWGTGFILSPKGLIAEEE